MLGILKKTQAAREFRISATTNRTLYRQGKITVARPASRTHLTEALETVRFIFWAFRGVGCRQQTVGEKRSSRAALGLFLILVFYCNFEVLESKNDIKDIILKGFPYLLRSQL